MTDEYQQFYEKWDDESSSSHFRDTFPYKLSLGVDQYGGSLLPFRDASTLGGKILVTKSYDDMFHRLLRLRNKYYGRGAVITGQPGIGGSL